MQRWSSNRKSLTTYATYVFIGLLFIVSALVLVRATLDIQRLRRAGAVPVRHGFFFHRNPAGSVSPNPSVIEGWMTFGYINKIFDLPRTYLSERLGIANTKYPNMQLARYAKEQGVAVDAFLGEVRRAVGEYRLEAVGQ